ncbi:homeobox-leucine zipper protein HDG5-like [Helianthus annuus]|uniref:homeobox-leucine zipper protein HDG5-like n=1 Tax=Helianthus annuus TaxID=4232 RepID=UPI000B8F8CDF|nr:homeobox-leucine zipper protein HDG5-like [Helianthus annuus]
MAFGARRWLAVLQRQCERLASLMARNISDIGAIPTLEARTNLMNVAHRMVRMFCLHITGSCGQSWTALSDSVEETVRITTRKVTEPGQPNACWCGWCSNAFAFYPEARAVISALRYHEQYPRLPADFEVFHLDVARHKRGYR